MNRRGRRCTLLVLAIALCLGGITLADSGSGITGVTKGPADVSVPPDVPKGETLRYGLGFPVQVGPTTGAVFVNLRIECMDPGDFENGSDVFLFSDLTRIAAGAPVRVTRNEKWTDPSGKKRILVKFPDIGGFVPLGAKRSDGSPHPYAGSGFASCQALEFPMTETGAFTWESKWLQHLEFHQFAFDGKQFRIVKTELHREGRPLRIGDSGWHLFAPGISNAIPDDDDLLEAVLAQHDKGGACGIVRWRPHSGIWRPLSFSPVAGTTGWSEPSLVRDTDGTLLFTARANGLVRVWRSSDSGGSWTVVANAPEIREPGPLSIGRAADGTPYIAANAIGQGRQVLKLWPLCAARTTLGAPVVAREAVKGRTQTVDHPNAATLRLADGKWHHVLVYRLSGGEDPTGDSGGVQTGCCVEEVFSRGAAIPVWRFSER